MHTSVSIPMISRQAVSERKGKGKTKMGKEDGSLTPRRKHEIKLPLNFVQRDRGDLVPESAYGPVADCSGEGVSSTADLHWHYFCHVDPIL